MVDIMKWFTAIIVVQLFYAFSITMIVNALPAGELQYVNPFTDIVSDNEIQNIGDDFSDAFEEQSNIPIIELGALVFYSGNILIDLLANFIFALPQMVMLVVNVFFTLFNVSSILSTQLQLFVTAIFTVLYVLGIIQLVTGIRSGRIV